MLSYLLAAECAIGGKGNLEEVAAGGTTGLISSPGEDGKMYFLASDNFNDEIFFRDFQSFAVLNASMQSCII